jgi:hypothetical protein
VNIKRATFDNMSTIPLLKLRKLFLRKFIPFVADVFGVYAPSNKNCLKLFHLLRRVERVVIIQLKQLVVGSKQAPVVLNIFIRGQLHEVVCETLYVVAVLCGR